MPDRIREAFLRHEQQAALALDAASDVVTLTAVAGDPPDTYVIDLRCKGLARGADGNVHVADRFVVGLHFGENYLRSVPDPFAILTVLHPQNAFQPNIAERAPFICVGHLAPGTGIVELVYQVWQIWTYRKYNLVDGLNADACRYARAHQADFPLDPRPLKRAAPSFTVEVREGPS
jgi:hypothetical protein